MAGRAGSTMKRRLRQVGCVFFFLSLRKFVSRLPCAVSVFSSLPKAGRCMKLHATFPSLLIGIMLLHVAACRFLSRADLSLKQGVTPVGQIVTGDRESGATDAPGS